MATREGLHRLVEDLPEEELDTAAHVLQALRVAADVPSYTLENAPFDDEPETPEERAAVEAARRDRVEGRVIPQDQLERELGLR